jgi:hypothetical protein
MFAGLWDCWRVEAAAPLIIEHKPRRLDDKPLRLMR